MNSNAGFHSDLRSLWQDAAELWNQHENAPAFEGYVGSDFEAALRTLESYQGRASTFLEWGSGLGVVAIMAARLGFEACGIEIQPELVALADSLAKKYDADVQFACGSFVPDEFEANLIEGDEFYRTATTAGAGYDELDRELRDFDLVYAYPWPDEQLLFRSIMRRCGAPGAVLISYDNREGISTYRHVRRKRSR